MAYGRTKVQAEASVLETPRGLVARLSLLYGRSRRASRATYLDRMIDGLRRGEPQSFFEDEYRTPLSLASAADLLARLTKDELAGIIHVGGPERISRFELARRSAAALGFDPELIRANRQGDVVLPEPRPSDVSLDSSKLAAYWPEHRHPTVEEALGD
jgi:dTDP-4-dehydrorhamnose reductase